jgi:hypothetical protein
MINAFLATVSKTYTESNKPLDFTKDIVAEYNGNKNFDKNDIRFLGAIEFQTEDFINTNDYAFPFDKNNITFPIVGETILILEIQSNQKNINYWLPYSITQYPNFREDVIISERSKPKEILKNDSSDKNKNYNEAKNSHTTGTSTNTLNKSEYKKNENIKFLKPREGDTIITGRAGNTIRFSEFFLTEDETIDSNGNPKGGTSSPSIFIRNKQNPTLDNEKIGTLVEESIDLDGTSVYITSGKVKIPFKETIKKQKVGFTEYPNSKELKGNQFFVNSDRIILSAKASEFIIFGKGNTGIITDSKFSIDAEKDIYLHTNSNLILHSKGNNQIFLNSDSGGNIYLGKNSAAGGAGADVQKMVLGGELIQVLSDLIDAITQQMYLTPAGPSSTGPTNIAQFNSIKQKLKIIQSTRNFLSK